MVDRPRMRELTKRFPIRPRRRLEPSSPETHSSRDRATGLADGGPCTVSAAMIERTGSGARPRAARPVRVLMFGWEFPPYQAGGLATATLGLVKGLLRSGMEVTLVVPFPIDGSALPALRLVSTAGHPIALRQVRVPSPVTAYGGVEEYAAARAAVARRLPGTRGTTPYGVNLFDEIERFA